MNSLYLLLGPLSNLLPQPRHHLADHTYVLADGIAPNCARGTSALDPDDFAQVGFAVSMEQESELAQREAKERKRGYWSSVTGTLLREKMRVKVLQPVPVPVQLGFPKAMADKPKLVGALTRGEAVTRKEPFVLHKHVFALAVVL
ncbi:hypothetical protein HJC23_010175 [Cyclotella cryptica]|uniref:Uncharacterized protein n=1 Tax=Cyclotella cryptica TaxID=29204 RepID=A0ABD3NJ77_9STRA